MRSKCILHTILCGTITAGVVAPASAIVIQNNSWTNASGGKWEDGTKWSLGVPPALGQAAIFVTNAVSKTVTIDTTTSGSFATNMTINDLTIGAPAGSVNTLLFQNPGTLTPFNVLDSATLSSGGVLTIDNALVNIANQLRNLATLTVAGGSLNVSGDFNSLGVSNAVWVTGGQLAAVGGNSFIGRVTVSNGTFLAHELFIGNPGQVGAGTLTVAGGLVALPVSFNGMVIGSNGGTGTVWQTGGQIITTNTDISIGGLFSPALGQMTISNGMLLAHNVFVGGQGDGVGTLTVAGGTVSADLLVATTNATINFPAGILSLRGADVDNDQEFDIGAAGRTAVLNLVGGTNRFGGAFVICPVAGSTGAVWITGGYLIVTNNFSSVGAVGVGQMTLSNGLFLASNMTVGDQPGAQGTYIVAGGTNVLSSDLAICPQVNSTGKVVVTGGQLVVTNGALYIGSNGRGQMIVSNAGVVLARNVVVSGTTTSSGTLEVGGGTFTMLGAFEVSAELGSTGTVSMTGGQLTVTNEQTTIGVLGTGRMNISNGVLLADTIVVGQSSVSDGTLTISGGTNILSSSLDIAQQTGATGTVWLTGGQLTVTNDSVFIGDTGVGRMTVSNGTWLVTGQVILGNSAGSKGTLTLAGGSSTFLDQFAIGNDDNATATVWMTGGQLITTNNGTEVGEAGVGQMTVSNGTWHAKDVFVGDNPGSRGTLTIAGGTNMFSSFLDIAHQAGATGTVWLTGGQLTVTNDSVIIGDTGVGRMTVSNGTWVASHDNYVGYSVGSQGTLTIAGGTNMFPFNLTLGYVGATGTLWMTGGRLTIPTPDSALYVGVYGVGLFVQSNGTAQLSGLAVPGAGNGRGTFLLTGGNITVDDLFMNFGDNATGTVIVTGGQLNINDAAVIGVRSGSARMTVSNGTVSARSAFLGATDGATGWPGILTIAGGVSSIYSNLTLGNFNCTATGTVMVTGGSLFVTNAAGNAVMDILSGTLNISNGFVQIDKIVITNACAHFARTGGTLLYTSTVLNPNDDSDGDGFTNQQEINAGTDPLDPLSFPSPVTSWTDGTGKWEVSTNWSAGAPSSSLQAVFVTNAVTKTVTINSATPLVNMTISNLTVSGSPGAVNTLQITNVGLATPFTILNSFTNSSGGNLVVTNSLLQVQGVSGDVFVNNGTFTILGGGVVSNATVMSVGSSANTTGSVWMTGSSALLAITNDDLIIGSSGVGGMTVSNGSVVVQSLVVGLSTGSQGTLTAAGGTITLGDTLEIGSFQNATGVVWLTGGQLVATNGSPTIGDSGVGQLTMSNGAMLAGVERVGNNAGSQGTLTITGGTNMLSSFLVVGNVANATGSVWITGSAGQLVVTNSTMYIGFLGVGQMTMSNGTMLAQDVTVGLSHGAEGRLTIAGGTNRLSSSLTVGMNVNATGSVWITGSTAQLVVTNGNMFIGNSSVGQMTVSNGTVLAQGVIVGANPGSQGTLSVAGGTNRLSSFLVIGESANSTGAMWVTSGQFVVTNSSTLIGDLGVGQMTVSNGTVLSEDMSVGTIAGSQGTLTTAGGTNRISSILALGNNANATGTVWMTGGQLVVTNNSTIIGVAGVGRMTVSNGIVRAQDVTVGADAGSQGMLTLAGGTVTATNIVVGVSDCTATGIVAVSGGSLFVTNAAGNATLEVQSGTLTISGGLLHADKIVITNTCAHFTRTGGTLIYGSAILNPADDTDGDGFSNQAELNAGSDPLDPTSVPPGQLSVAPAALSFGTIATGMTAQASFIVSNSAVGLLSGSATVTGGPLAIVSGSPFSLSGHGSTNVVVQFAPVSTGAFTNKVVFNAGVGGTSSNTVSGTGAALPVANFTAAPTNGVVPLTVTFTNTSTGTITNDVWSFGDTTTSNTTATVLTHTYNAAGSYSVSLIAQGPVGVSTNSKPNLIHALNPPHLVVAPSSRDYGAVTIGVTNTLPFSVINTGDLALTGTVATVSPFAVSGASSYTVQPGQTGTVQVSFIPTSSGSFSNNVVFSSNGGASTNSVVGTGASVGHIVVSPAALDFGTIATGTMSQRVFVVSNGGGTTVTNGTVTVSAPFAILSGQQFSVPALGSTNVVVEFAPSGAGVFTNQVVFATANGGSSTNQVTGMAAIAPAAVFTAAPTNGAAPLSVNFSDASTGVITNRLWNFGDTGTSTLASPSHTYSNAGVYSVSLTVFGPVGSSATNRLNLITVTNVVTVAGFTASPTNGAAPLLVSFSDTSTGTTTNRLWTFGDGATSAASLVMHTYSTAGVYSVSLMVFGPGGSDTLNQPGLITVTNVPPTAGFTANPTNGVAPLSVDFTDTSTGTITNRLWDFGDGGSSTVTSPSHTYTNAGNFSVTLIVLGPNGTDALTQPDLIVVTSGPTNADLEVIKLGSPNPVFVASNLTYTIIVTNHGPATATSITLTDALPTSVSFSSASDECTNTGGIVVCDLGSLDAGEATNVTLVVVPTMAGKLTNTASIAATETDPVPANNTVTNTVTVTVPPLGTNDLAVVKLKAPKKIVLSATITNKVGKFSVSIQNRGPLTETIPDLAALSNLVTVSVQSLGTNCASFSATLVPPKASFPINIAPKKKLTLMFTAIFDCANDPLASTKTTSHADYRTTASVDLGALDEVDTTTSNDLCPRLPNPAIGDPGCGNKDPVTKQPGADVLTDVVVKP